MCAPRPKPLRTTPQAVADRLIAESPAHGVKAPKVTPRRIRPKDTNSIVALADAMPTGHRALIILCAGTGLRQAEAFGLTRNRIDLEAQTIEIDRQLMRTTNGRKSFGPLRTDASYRSVPLPQVVCDALEEHLATRGPCYGDDLVFVDEQGRPLMWRRFNDALHEACASAGVDRITSHDLRHYYASLLIRRGENVKVVQARLGHASASDTLDTYAHLWPDSVDRTRDAVDDVLGPEFTGPNLSAHGA
ncbi:tyrosine-type recombinase/integrase [Demequina lutea]